MKKVLFIYMKNKYEMNIQNKNITLYETIIKYSSLIDKDLKKLYFLYNGNKILLNKKLKGFYIKKNIILFFYDIGYKKSSIHEHITNIKCAQCNGPSEIYINNNKISEFICSNNHILSNLSINTFKNLQLFAESEVECDLCKNNKNNYENFYKCSCNKNICPLCLEKHRNNNNDNIEHTNLNYNQIFYKCLFHNKEYVSYCKNCNKNLCAFCERIHDKHNIIIFKKIIPNEKKINEMNNKIINNIESINKLIQDIKELNNYINTYFNNIIKNLTEYIYIYHIIISFVESGKSW